MDWFCVTEPFLMINQPHTHDFDQFLAFQGSNPLQVNDFDAEVWLYMGAGDEQETGVTETCVVHIQGSGNTRWSSEIENPLYSWISY
jgi:hypothetical protein